MIATFRSKALKAFWEEGEARRLPVENHARVRRQLLAIDAASRPEDVNVPGYKFHGLNTDPKRWSIWVTGNYRITFGWDGGNAMDLDIEDYH
jgi:Plasmid maintenance system killer protein